MFSIEELNSVIQQKDFLSDYSLIQQSLLNNQVKQESLFQTDVINRLAYLTEAILTSSSEIRSGNNPNLFKIGGETAEVLSMYKEFNDDLKKRFRLRAAVLYELAEMPAISSTIMRKDDYPFIYELFGRKDILRFLNIDELQIPERQIPKSYFAEGAISGDIFNYAEFAQGKHDAPEELITNSLTTLSKEFSFDFSASELNALETIIRMRIGNATRSNIDADLFEWLKAINFPVELWKAQVQAIHGGLLESKHDSWGLASPTGTGKTFLTRLLIVSTLKANEDAKILYVVPSRALVYEVSNDLKAVLGPLGFNVLALSAQMTELLPEDKNEFDEASVVVLTPEKADLLLRISQETLSEVRVVIVDEAHHIEGGTRGVLLELYLWRLKKMLKQDVRYIFLSAVAPNIAQLTSWLGSNPGSVTITERATRMRAGVYKKIKGENGKLEGWIEYSDNTKVKIISEKLEATQNRGLVQLCEKLVQGGPVLVVAKGKSTCEKLALEMQEFLKKNGKLKELTNAEKETEFFKRLDSRLEREMYPSVPMRELLINRIVYHHAGLPPRVRMAVERFIKKGYVDFVFATTTLAEGVNFPFSSVIVQSLVNKETSFQKGAPVRYHPVSPRTFWNIAGRAGRPGFDKEGQVILYEESLGASKVNLVMADYLNPDPKNINPVKSALYESLIELSDTITAKNITLNQLNTIALDDTIPKKVKGTINLLRVGLVHAKATNILNSPEDILEGSFAKMFMNDASLTFARSIISQQSTILNDFFKSKGAPSEKLVAEIGLSLQTIEELRSYVLNMQDWQIENFGRLFYGGNLNFTQIPYIIGPVSKRIAELEGERLGGIYSEIITNWLSGVPLSVVRGTSKGFTGRLEDLISIIYSRIQFLLPWGLYATDSIIEEEAKKRNIPYNNEVRKLSYLTDAGVPNFDSLRLVNLNFERVDATRLTKYYQQIGGQDRLGVDILGWISNEDPRTLATVIRGIDGRRTDYDLNSIIANIRGSGTTFN